MKDSRKYILQCKSIDNQIEFYGMRRSGHHAIMEWIFSQVKYPIFFFNDIEPYVKLGSLYDSGFWKNPLPGGRYGENFGFYSFNYEDAPIKDLKKYMKKYEQLVLFKKAKKVKKVFVLRDPFNMFASRIKFFREKNIQAKSNGKRLLRYNEEIAAGGVGWYNAAAVERWCEYAREFIGETNYYDKKIFIDYNKWCADEEYRKSIAKSFSSTGSYNDLARKKVPSNGGGSSFDFREFHGKGHMMKTDERWRVMIKDDEYLDVINNSELIRLAEKVYPDLTSQVLGSKK